MRRPLFTGQASASSENALGFNETKRTKRGALED
jgi:hypothetical protein